MKGIAVYICEQLQLQTVWIYLAYSFPWRLFLIGSLRGAVTSLIICISYLHLK